jgi:glycerol-3-phosphate dehydrogenase
LIRRYGAEAARVAALADGHPDLLEPLAPGLGVRGVELVFAVRCEGARSVADVLERRTRLSLVPADLAAALPRAEEILDAIT